MEELCRIAWYDEDQTKRDAARRMLYLQGYGYTAPEKFYRGSCPHYFSIHDEKPAYSVSVFLGKR